MRITAIKTEWELDQVIELVFNVFPHLENGHKYDRAFWINRLREQSELLLYATEEEVVLGACLAWPDEGQITLAIYCVAEAHRGKGVGTRLVGELENRARALRYDSLSLGSAEGAETFYVNLGYTGTLLIQSELYDIDTLKSLNTEYEVVFARVYEGSVNQLCLRVPNIDRALQRKYEEGLPGYGTLMMFKKIL